MRAFIAALGIVLCCAGLCRAEDSIKDQLLAADRAFARATAEKGLDGWMSFMSADTARTPKLGGKIVAGKEAARKLDAPKFANPNLKLSWDPTDAHAFADGKHGFTTGRFKMVVKDAAGKEDVKVTGSYITWWRKDREGWRVIFDTGNSDQPRKP